MSSSIARARLTVAGLLSASLALLPIQPSRAALLYSNNFDTAPVLAPGAVVTTPLSNGIIQAAINNLAWPSWKDKLCQQDVSIHGAGAEQPARP